ncbi:MAG: hypothetical protein M3Y27_08850, partial [Acidobacteriota bacterium]|nr:hypothetical protein [Acidobacteriota bacterium]
GFTSGPTVAKSPAPSKSTRLAAKTRTVLKLPARVVLRSRSGLRQAGIALVAGFLFGLLILMPAGYLYRFHRESAPLRLPKDYAHRNISAIASDWNLYRDLERRSGFLGPLSPAPSLAVPFHTRLVAAADSVIDGYRQTSALQLNQVDWKKAQFCLRRALQMNPNDSKAKGRLALCNAYLNLLQNPKLPKARLSLVQFKEAEHLLPQSPDPHLGLARLYIYSYHNVAPAIAEIHKAEKLGYQSGAREAKEAADGYRFRSEWENLRAKYTVPKRAGKKWVSLARSDIQRAQQWH